MLERVAEYIERYHLLPASGGIVVGVSGGADSLCLLHLLCQFCGPAARYPALSVQAAHLNHMLRGDQSEHDARAVAEMMRVWNVPFTLGAVDVPALARIEKRSLEDAARVARYHFLREVAQGQPIAVAHHADDQVETLLLHWLRGSGLSGMVGMLPRQQDIIRPLLEITRAEIVAYCREHGIVPLEDRSNTDPRFLRNRVRHELLPLLQELNPGIQRTLLRNAEVASVDLAWLEAQVDAHWKDAVRAEQEHTVVLSLAALLNLPLSLQRHLLRRVTANLCAGQSPLEPRHLVLIEQFLNASPHYEARELHFPDGLRLRVRHDDVLFERLHSQSGPLSEAPEQSEVILPIPGMVDVPTTPWQAIAEMVPETLTDKVHHAVSQGSWTTVWKLLAPASPYSVFVDGATLGSQILVRTRRPGDRIQPLGMAVEKRIQDVLVDARVPRARRANVPLFFSESHCVWVAGVCLDQRVRLTNMTRRIVHLSVHPRSI